MTFKECVDSIHEGSVISFKEYAYDRHERKKMTMSVNDVVVSAVLPANETISRDTLTQYYGDELDDLTYMQLATMNCPRVVVNLGINQNNEMDIKVLVLNQDFYDMGLQEVEITNEVDPNNLVEPNYVLAQGGWM